MKSGPVAYIMNRFKRMHMHNQQLLVSFLLFLGPVFLFLVVFFGFFFNSLRDSTIRANENTVRQIASNINLVGTHLEDTALSLSYSERTQDYMTAISRGEKISNADQYAMEQGLALFFDNSCMRSVSLVSDKGYALVQNPITLPDLSGDVVDIFREHDASSNRAKWYFDSEQELIHLIKPIVSLRNYSRLGYIDIIIYPDFFKKQISAIDLGESGGVCIFDTNGKIITYADSAPWEKLFSEISTKESAVEYEEIGDSLVFLGHPDSPGWLIACYISRNSVFGMLFNLLAFVGIVLALIIVSAFFVAAWFTRHTHNQISAITSAMSLFSSGDLAAHAPEVECPEFNEMGEHFNKMVDRTRHLIDSEYKSKLHSQQAELKMLQAQINPHFLFNTLNIMYWKAQIAKQNELAKMAVSLSNLFRATIDRTQEFLTIGDEVKHVEEYLFIQRMRYQDKIHVSILIPEDIYGLKIPKFLIQPVVENAFSHGLEPKKGSGNIEITGQATNDDILFTIRDDGIGMSEEVVRSLLEEKKDKEYQGLYNVQKRIELIYGEGYGLDIHSVEGEGTTITIRIRRIE